MNKKMSYEVKLTHVSYWNIRILVNQTCQSAFFFSYRLGDEKHSQESCQMSSNLAHQWVGFPRGDTWQLKQPVTKMCDRCFNLVLPARGNVCGQSRCAEFITLHPSAGCSCRTFLRPEDKIAWGVLCIFWLIIFYQLSQFFFTNSERNVREAFPL